MDHKEKLQKSLLDEEEMKENKKFCGDCKTTKTPLWRSGPAGPKSLCNACGIRFRKKRRSIAGLEKSNRDKKKERSNSMNTSTSSVEITSNSTVGSGGNGLSESVKKKLMVLGKEMMLQRSSIVKKQRCRRRRKMGEEEQAAFSLMAMSCGSVIA